MTTTRRHYVEPFLGGGAVLLGLKGTAPFLRWAGGKRRLFDEITKRLHRRDCPLSHVSATYSSCGCFHFDSYLVADVNADLIAAWQAVRDDVESALQWIRRWPRDAEGFYRIRRVFNLEKATTPTNPMSWNHGAAVIYLNLFGYCGLWRENAAGELNTPVEHKRFEKVSDAFIEKALRNAAALLQGVDIVAQDFATTLSQCGEGDVAYVDSPYLPDDTSKFVSYSASGTDWSKPAAHEKVAMCVLDAAQRGARVVVSNSKAALPIYDAVFDGRYPFSVDVVKARRSVSQKAKGRGVVDEILVTVGE